MVFPSFSEFYRVFAENLGQNGCFEKFSRRTYTPAEVQLIYDVLGEP